MHQDYTKICRVCMSDGSRDIFHKPSVASSEGTTTTSSAVKGTSPLERLLEKLRYVTMMKIEENDDLPRLLCDLCIVQLNVAYNFKRQAVENDTKLRQYFIENGISSNQSAVLNDVSIVRNPFTTNSHAQSQAVSRFPILPIIIKTEPSDVDAFSDVTTETNIEMDRIDRNRFQSEVSNTINSSPEENSHLVNTSLYSNDRSQSSMVYVNSGYEFNSVTPSSDIEFVQNYQMNKGNNNNISRAHDNAQRQSSLIRESSENRSPSARNRSPANPLRRENKRIGRTQTDKDKDNKSRSKREIENLSIDMVPSTVTTNVPKEHRRSLGKTTRVRPRDGTLTSTPKSSTSTSKLTVKTIANVPSSATKSISSPAPLDRPSISVLSQPPVKKSHIEGRIKDATPKSNKHENSTNSNNSTQKLIVLNPFNASKQASKLKTHRKLENSAKKKRQEKLLRPKIEPPAAKKN